MLKALLHDEKRLLLAVVAIVALLNVPYGSYVLYPFELFSTWVHEMGHGMAALAVGGKIEWLKIFPDGSGLASTYREDTRINNAVIGSAGYLGTSVFGALLLTLRRFRRIGRLGTLAIGGMMVLSTVLWIRNGFGALVIPLLGAALIFAGLKLKDEASSFLFSLLAATCSLNALTSIKVLFGGSSFQVGGESVSHTDATSVAEQLLLPSWFWAGSWMLISVALLILGLRLGMRRSAAPLE